MQHLHALISSQLYAGEIVNKYTYYLGYIPKHALRRIRLSPHEYTSLSIGTRSLRVVEQ